jgi:hypothetical protein
MGWMVSVQKIGALVTFWGFSEIFVEFWKVYCDLGPNCKYFFETEGPAIIFPSV